MRTGALLSAVLLCALTACSDSPGEPRVAPPAPPPVSASPSPSSSPSRSPLVAPANMNEPTVEGARSFAAYYFELMNRAYGGADVGPLKALSDPRCGACGRYLEDIKTRARLGSRGPFEVTGAGARLLRPDVAIVDLLAGNRAALAKGQQSSERFVVTLYYETSGWRVREINTAGSKP